MQFIYYCIAKWKHTRVANCSELQSSLSTWEIYFLKNVTPTYVGLRLERLERIVLGRISKLKNLFTSTSTSLKRRWSRTTYTLFAWMMRISRLLKELRQSAVNANDDICVVGERESVYNFISTYSMKQKRLCNRFLLIWISIELEFNSIESQIGLTRSAINCITLTAKSWLNRQTTNQLREHKMWTARFIRDFY